MEFTFENQGTHTYLVYAVKPEDTVDTMSLGMLTNNKIPGLAAVQFTQKDAEKFIKYNISARVSVRQFLEGVVNRQRLVGVLQGIVTGLRSSREYMIDPKSVVMDLDYMFVDVSTYQTALVCLPLMNVEASQVDLGMLLKDIVFHTQFDQTENGDYIAKLLNYLNKPTPFSLDEFGDVLDGIGQGGLTGMSQAPAPAAPVQPNVAPAPAPAPAPVAAPQAVEPPPTPAYTDQGKKAAKKPLVRGGAPVPPKAAPVPPKATPMAAPVPPKAGKEKEQNAQPQQTQEKEISFFYLMQHYNKENAAAYKAQKQAKKEAKQAGGKGKEKPPKKAKDKGVPPSYSVPGQSAPQAAGPAAVPASAPVAAPTAPSPGPVPTAAPAPQPVAAPQPVQPTPPQPRPTMNFGETTVLMGGAAGETTVLGVGPGMTPATQPHLIRRKNNEKIPINKPVFRIGKERSYVDYFIGDNTAISRSHANFIIREGQYSVVDTNSTNHTFVNGTMVPSNQEVVVSHGDVIRLANEDFEFRLY